MKKMSQPVTANHCRLGCDSPLRKRYAFVVQTVSISENLLLKKKIKHKNRIILQNANIEIINISTIVINKNQRNPAIRYRFLGKTANVIFKSINI